jgi:paraquat-inducible protein B
MDTSSSLDFSKYQIYKDEEDMQNSTSIVTIIFDDVEGVQENFSRLTYKGVNIGKVKKVSLNKDQKIEVKALIDEDFSSFAKEGTVFYLKKPRISFQEVANIGSTVMAVNIGVIKSQQKTPQTVFKGSNEPVLAESAHYGTVFKVEDATASSVGLDAPVYYKNVRIGKISKVDLSADGSKVILDCLIYDKYKKLIRKNSQFYDISGFEMEFSIFGGSKVESNTFASLIKGGLVVVTPYDYGEMASQGDRFTLNKTLKEGWKNISPSIK